MAVELSEHGRGEKRLSPRLHCAHMAEYRVPGSAAHEAGRLKDISAGGFLFSVERRLEPGTGLSVILLSDSSQLVTEAWVVRCAPAVTDDVYEVGCAFD